MKISVIAHPFSGEKEQFSLLKQCGFDGCDFSLTPYFSKNGMFGDIDNVTDEQIKEHFTMLREEAEKNKFKIFQTHAENTGHLKHYPGGVEEMVKRTVASIKATHYLGAEYCVVHPLFSNLGHYEQGRESFRNAAEFYRRLIPTLEEYGVYCCLENMWNVDKQFSHICPTIFSDGKEMVDMCELLGDRFRICVDIGHGLLTGHHPVEMLKICKDKLACLHVHDNDGLCDLHTFPYSLFEAPYALRCQPLRLDWTEVMNTLKEIGYNGAFSFEIAVPGPDKIKTAGLKYLAEIGRYLTSI